MRILITGISGFVGSHLADYILALDEGHEIYGMCRWRSSKDNIYHILNKIQLYDADLCDATSTLRCIDTIRPDIIFHLAAQSFVPVSFDSPASTLNTNGVGTINLLEAVRLSNINPVIHICSSSEVYGQVLEHELPITEKQPFRPASPYAVSKCTEDLIGYQYFLSHGLKTIRTRSFTHTGPRRGETFVMSHFAKQIVMAELRISAPVITVGNLHSIRTFLDVRDIVKAYWMLITKCEHGEVYNIAGKETMSIKKALELMLSFSKIEVSVEIDKSLLRPSDVTLQVPSIAKFIKATGWEASIPLEKTFKDMLDYWRVKIKSDNGGYKA